VRGLASTVGSVVTIDGCCCQPINALPLWPWCRHPSVDANFLGCPRFGRASPVPPRRAGVVTVGDNPLNHRSGAVEIPGDRSRSW
jgi:hypothetical protein